jgi:hypothetical protein
MFLYDRGLLYCCTQHSHSHNLATVLYFCFQIQSKFLLTTQLSVEGPIRMKEEYVEGLIEIPRINEESLPEQLKGLLGQTAGALQQLPSPIRDAVSEGLKLPLSKYTGLHTLLAIC